MVTLIQFALLARLLVLLRQFFLLLGDKCDLVLGVLLLRFQGARFGVLGNGLIPSLTAESLHRFSETGLVLLVHVLRKAFLLGLLRQLLPLLRDRSKLILRIFLLGLVSSGLVVLGLGIIQALTVEGHVGCGDGSLVLLLHFLGEPFLFGLLRGLIPLRSNGR